METPSRIENLSLQDEIVVALPRIARAVHLQSRMLMQNHGRIVPQLATLQAIPRLQPATAGVIAKHVHLGQPTVAGILNRREERRQTTMALRRRITVRSTTSETTNSVRANKVRG